MKPKKLILIAMVVLIGTGAGIGYYQYNKPPVAVADLKAEPVNAVNLFKDFSSNEQQANKVYLNKALQVSGTVLEVKQKENEKAAQIILDGGDPMFGIACTLDNNAGTLKPGDHVTIKGICTGYLNDVVLIKSLLLN